MSRYGQAVSFPQHGVRMGGGSAEHEEVSVRMGTIVDKLYRCGVEVDGRKFHDWVSRRWPG